METKGVITNSDYRNVNADIIYENNQLIISTKPVWVRLAFGIVGEALANSKERFRINISDIEEVEVKETWAGKPVYELKLVNKDFCKIVFNSNDVLLQKLSYDLKEKLVRKK